MSSSSTTIIKVRRLGTSRKEGHDYFKYELYNSSNNNNKTIASISGRFSQFLPFSQDVIKLFPWLSLSSLQQPLIPLATISEELLKERELKIQTMLYVIANDSMNNNPKSNNYNSSTKTEQSSTSPLKYLLSRKEFIKSNEQQKVSHQEQTSAIPTASEIDALIAPTSAITPSASTIPTSSEIDALIAPGAPDTSRKNNNNSQFIFIPHQDNFDLSHFATHLVSWNAAVQFTENLEKEIESLRTNFRKLSKDIYQDLYEKTLDDFGESSKRVFVECDAFRDEQEDSGDFLDDCDENENDCKSFTSSSSSSPASAKEKEEEQQQEDLTPPPPRPVPSNPNANDDDDGDDENQVAPTSTTTGKNKTTHFVDPNLANKKKKLEKPSSNNNTNNQQQQQQHPLNQLVTIAAMYSQRGLDAIPNTVVDVASIILTFVDGAKGLAKRRRDMWLKMYQTLMEAHRLEIQHEEKINPSSSSSSSSKTTSPTNSKQNQKQPPLPSNQSTTNTHNNNNNTILVSSASLIRGASSRHESEADILKDMIRSSSLDCENVYEESFKNFKALFEKMYHEDLMRNICESVTSKPSQVA